MIPRFAAWRSMRRPMPPKIANLQGRRRWVRTDSQQAPVHPEQCLKLRDVRGVALTVAGYQLPHLRRRYTLGLITRSIQRESSGTSAKR